MRVYRNGIKICLVICIVSCLLLLMGFFNLPIIILHNIVAFMSFFQNNARITDFIYDMLLGVFASAFVVMITYIGAYRIEKGHIIGLVKHYCSEYVMEISNLVPLLIEISENRVCRYNWESINNKIKSDTNVHGVVVTLQNIHNDRLLNVDGYYPFLRKERINLEVHHLICMLAKINGAIQYCDTAYKLNNNIVCRIETNDFKFSEEELKKQVDIILQTNENNEYQHFFDLLQKVMQQSKSISIYNSNWEGKCS